MIEAEERGKFALDSMGVRIVSRIGKHSNAAFLF
jgi:hypothetical protein